VTPVLSGQQREVLMFIQRLGGSCGRDSPARALRLRGGQGKTMAVLQRLGLVRFEAGRWYLTEAGRAA